MRWVLPVIGAAAAVIVLYWLYRGLDFDRFLQAVAGANAGWLGALVATILLEQLTRGWKWRQILFDLKPVSSLRLFGSILAGYGVGVLVPVGVSPLVRSWLVARLENLRWMAVLMTTAIERFLDGIVFAMIAALVAIAGHVPGIEGDLRCAIMLAGGLNLVLFAGLMSVLFLSRSPLARDASRISRLIDWISTKDSGRLAGLRGAILQGIIWPRARARQVGAVLASILMKIIAATHFVWAGLAVGVVLAPLDYLFVMVVAGFALVLARFVRVPGGFVLGAGFALNLLGVPGEQALAMILFNHSLSIVLMVGIGLLYLWRSGIDITAARRVEAGPDGL